MLVTIGLSLCVSPFTGLLDALVPDDKPRDLLLENRRLQRKIVQLEAQLQKASSIAPSHPNGAVVNASTALTRSRLQVLGTSVILTFTNKARVDFAKTWASHMWRLGLTNWLIGATDAATLHSLLELGIPCFDMHTKLPEVEWAWGSGTFHSLGPAKVQLIEQALLWGFELIITDIDALVLRDPFPFMARFPDAGFLTTSDHLSNTTTATNGELETHAAAYSAYNIGYMFFRPSALPMVSEWRQVIEQDPIGKWDQGEFNRIARSGWRVDASGLSSPALFRAYNGKVVGGVLPLTLFCGGHNYFIAQMPMRMGLMPYSVHTTFQFGAVAGKRHRLREAKYWEDGPEYYDPPGGLLRYIPSLPPLSTLKKTVHGHIDLINHQLKQLGGGLAYEHYHLAAPPPLLLVSSRLVSSRLACPRPPPSPSLPSPLLSRPVLPSPPLSSPIPFSLLSSPLLSSPL
eukprot:CAMPEP_0174716556 /NCGR_PEP_ID=MMETSP1094-20130205/24314_1 /TAXON_ID=156173 /ORGANISM="Chrysochromulina brevifilum, Strain UTEX LB 985" /LENGTH=457 /DNA_ID=CAMNT_0015916325 /DNA_START=83 /DNA_END=1452 /DNA_ORIENTATION=-